MHCSLFIVLRNFLYLSVIALVLNSCTTPLYIIDKNMELYIIEDNGMSGYMDQKGNVRIPPQYDIPTDFDHCSDWVSIKYEEYSLIVKSKGKYGLINFHGDTILPFIYTSIKDNYDGEFIIGLDQNFGVVDSSGNEIIPMIFSSDFIDKEGEYYFGDVNNYSIRFNPHTSEYLRLAYQPPLFFFDGLASVQGFNEKYGLIDINSSLIIDTIYDFVGHIGENLINVNKDGDWFYIDTNMNVIIPGPFEKANSFWSPYATVKKEGKYGVIDTLGNIIIPPIYEYIDSNPFQIGKEPITFDFYLSEDYWNSKIGVLNLKGDTIVEPKYKSIYIESNTAVEEKDNLYGLVRLSDGKLLIPYEFMELEYWTEGLSKLKFSDESGKKYFGYINKRRKIIWSNNNKLLKEKLQIKP